jgi:glycine/D-amino acid oxidase-like deaminating enzyme
VTTNGAVNGRVSFWWEQRGRDAPRPPLPGPISADVCIVGAGYTGLWTAYYLKRAAPERRVVVLEQRFAGFGASGRNGGWLTNSITGGRERYVRSHGAEAAHRLQAALNDTVDEVVRVAAAEGIDADVVRGGELTVATNAAQLHRLRAAAEAELRWGDTDLQILDAANARERVGVAGTQGGVWHPHAARIHPAKLAAGLARAVCALGVEIFEDTPVTAIAPGRVTTARGVVEAPFVVRGTEGFTARIAGERRTWLPMNSSLMVTAPLPERAWREIGWAGREVLGDAAHAYVYAQRTADDRIALGGRGVPYRFGSRHDVDGATPASTVRGLLEVLHRFFPVTRGTAVDHAWSGVLGVPRDWSATVGLDPATGLAWAGGYVGTGVAATNLAGRTLVDLLLGRTTPVTDLPWVNHRVRRWEPEPLRWLGVRALYTAYRAADRAERTRRSTSPLATVADLISGRGH